jgi:hypothetical protein
MKHLKKFKPTVIFFIFNGFFLESAIKFRGRQGGPKKDKREGAERKIIKTQRKMSGEIIQAHAAHRARRKEGDAQNETADCVSRKNRRLGGGKEARTAVKRDAKSR